MCSVYLFFSSFAVILFKSAFSSSLPITRTRQCEKIINNYFYFALFRLQSKNATAKNIRIIISVPIRHLFVVVVISIELLLFIHAMRCRMHLSRHAQILKRTSFSICNNSSSSSKKKTNFVPFFSSSSLGLIRLQRGSINSLVRRRKNAAVAQLS